MGFLIESGEELREQFSEEELNCAWANREEYWRNEIFEKGGTLGEALPGLAEQQSFWKLYPDEIQFWIDEGPYIP